MLGCLWAYLGEARAGGLGPLGQVRALRGRVYVMSGHVYVMSGQVYVGSGQRAEGGVFVCYFALFAAPVA